MKTIINLDKTYSVDVEEVLEKKVVINGASGRVNLPKKLLNRNVLVLVIKE